MPDKNGNIRQLHLMTGSLLSAPGVPIPYWPVEISQFSFSALTDAQLEFGQLVELKTASGTTKLKISHINSSFKGTGYFLARFSTTSDQINLEKILRDVPELKRWDPDDFMQEPIKLPFGNLNVRAARFETPDHLRVYARTFGTRGDFVMYTENVSKSGMLIREDQEVSPFSLNTILELTIDPDAKRFAEPVRCLAKIVRHEPVGQNSRYGIQLIEMDHEIQTAWSFYVEELEREILAA